MLLGTLDVSIAGTISLTTLPRLKGGTSYDIPKYLISVLFAGLGAPSNYKVMGAGITKTIAARCATRRWSGSANR